MNDYQVGFDHIEAHVQDIPAYAEFLKKLFGGGNAEVISNSGTMMYTAPEGIMIEIKKQKGEPVMGTAGFCNPCLKAKNAASFVKDYLGLTIDKEVDGPVYFFKDPEGITWHIKEMG